MLDLQEPVVSMPMTELGMVLIWIKEKTKLIAVKTSEGTNRPPRLVNVQIFL